MHNALFRFLTFFVLITIATTSGCTRLDTSNIGGDLIPEVDNINTFADTLDVISSQGVFDGIYKDSTKLSYTEEYVVGRLNDPLLGTTQASLYLQFKPNFYPYTIGKLAKDTIVSADSVVLCLSYKAFYGDSSQPLQLQVFEVENDIRGEWDSVLSQRTINYAPGIGAPLSDIKTVDIRQLDRFVKLGKFDSVNNQIRIKLYDRFRDSLFTRDTIRNKAFSYDSLFRRFCNGFGIKASSGNALVYVNLLEAQTRLELHYKRKNGGPIDTTYSSLYFNSGLQGEVVRRSSVSNKIERVRNPLPTGAEELYLQTTPGTFANLEIPALTNYPNRIIHHAELMIQQIPDPINDKIFVEPNYLYLDLIDSGSNKWKPVYFDLNPGALYDPDFKKPGYPFFPSNFDVDFRYYGGYVRKRESVSGSQAYYAFNISRHIQQIATQKTANFKFRVFPAHSFSYPQYAPVMIPYRNPIAFGRVRVGGGAHPNPQYRMRLRVIYSKIK